MQYNINTLITSSVVFSVTVINISYSCLQVNDIYLLRLFVIVVLKTLQSFE